MGRIGLKLSPDVMKARKAAQKRESRARRLKADPSGFRDHQANVKWKYRYFKLGFAEKEAKKKRLSRAALKVPIPAPPPPRLTKKQREAAVGRFFR